MAFSQTFGKGKGKGERNVTVQNLIGESLHLRFPQSPTQSIADLKRAVAESPWKIPVACQSIIPSSAVVVAADQELLIENSYQLVLQLPASKHDIVRMLGSPLLGVPVFSAYLRHTDNDIRQAAWKHVKRISRQQKPHVVVFPATLKAVLSCLDDASSDVQSISFQALVDFASGGHDLAIAAAISAALSHLSQPNINPQHGWKTVASLELISKFARDRQDVLASTAKQYLWDGCGETRAAALRAMTRCVTLGVEPCVSLVTYFIDDVYPRVRSDALRAMSTFVDMGIEVDVLLAVTCLNDSNENVRSVATTLLANFAEGRSHVASWLYTAIADAKGIARERLLRQLPLFVEAGDQQAVNFLLRCLEDGDASVRVAALRLLPQVAIKDDQCVLAAVGFARDHGDDVVRQAARRSLAKLVQG